MANKTKEDLLAAYKKASKPARLVIIGKAGFISEQEYFDYLDTLTGASHLFKSKDEKEKEETENAALDMVICFDTTGSMSSYIGAVRQHVKDLIPRLFEDNSDLRLKIVAFGDYCDMLGVNNFGSAYQSIELTNNQHDLIRFVETARNTGGGDADEFYELVIHKVLNETDWRPEARKAALLIGDCSPHPVGYSYRGVVTNNQIDWRKEAQRCADIKLQWDTLSCGHLSVETFYRPLSEITGGVNIPFQTSSKTQDVVYAATSVRGGLKGKAAFTASYNAALKSGDKELMGSYKSLSKLL